MPKLDFIIQSWDTALTNKEESCYNACTTWGVFQDNDHNDNIILLSLWMGKVGYPELRERAKRLYFDYKDTGKISKPSRKPVDMCLIEAKASGDILIKDLQSAGIRPVHFNPTGDKAGRARVISAWIEAGLVWVPAEAPDFKNPVPWAEHFLALVASFPKNDDSKDVVDTMTQAFSKLRDMGYIMHPKDEIEEATNYKEYKIY
jgi:predicted phage terminase large subunit-like protein